MLAEGFEIHEEIAEMSGDGGDAFGEVGDGDGVVGMFPVGEAKGDEVGEVMVPQKELDVVGVVRGRLKQKRGAAAVEDGGPAFSEGGGEAEFADDAGDIVGPDEFGVAEGGGEYVEKAFEDLAVKLDLVNEFRTGIEGRERVVVRFGQKFDAAGLGEGVQEVERFRGVVFELFKGAARDGQGEAEASLVLLDEVQEEAEGGEVAMLGDAVDDDLVVAIVEVVMGGVEDGVLPEAEGLVDLEIETDGGHGFNIRGGMTEGKFSRGRE